LNDNDHNSSLSRPIGAITYPDTEFSTEVGVAVCETNGDGKVKGAVSEYVLERKVVQDVGIPSGSTILSVYTKDGQVVFCALGDSDRDIVDTDTYRFYVFNSGKGFDTAEVSPDMFIGSVPFENSMVHIFCKALDPEDTIG
jgi:hypothetical protein